MLKILTLVFALLGLLTAVALESWLRSRMVRNGKTAATYAEVRSRYAEFWSIQYIPLVVVVAIISAAIFFFKGHLDAAVFLGGAVLCFVALYAGSASAVTGSIAPSSEALSGDIRGALKCSYRSAAVLGLTVTSLSLIGVGVLFSFLKTEQLMSYAASFALGACVISLCTGLSGTAFSGAYALNVGSDDFTDYNGMIIGAGADNADTYILSVCSAALLAGVGVDVSGVTSTFTTGSAARYPVIVLAAGICVSVIGAFVYRGRIVKDPSSGLTAGNYVAAVIVAVVSLYFSNRVLQSYTYAYCVIAGLIAALAAGEISRLFSSDGLVFRRTLPRVKKIGASRSMLYSQAIGMVSVAIPAIVSMAAMIVAYKFADFYGIALAAVGINSIAAVNTAVRGFAINAASASEITSVTDPETESPNPADVLLTASARSDSIGKTYTSVSSFVTLVAMFTALSVVTENTSVNLLNTAVFTGAAAGVFIMFVAAGLIIRSIRLTGRVLSVRLSDSEDPEKRITSLRGLIPVYLIAFFMPLAAGLLCGASGMISFSAVSALTGMGIIFMFNCSGRFYDRIATESLGTVVKFMLAVSLVFAPAFMSFGGIF